MRRKPRVVVFGSASWNTMIRVDGFPEPRPGTAFPTGWHETVGSSGAGTAMSLARLGLDVVLHCQLGDDDAGERVRSGLEAAGVTVNPVADSTGTSRHVNLMDPAGDRLSFLLHTGDFTARYDPGRVEQVIRGADHVLVAIVDPARTVIPLARRLGVPTWTDLHDAHGQTDYVRDFRAADHVFLSGDNLPDPRPFMEQLIAEGRRLVVCTRGARGAVALTGEGQWLEVPAEIVETVVDTNGAGDAFLAGVVYGELHGLPVERSLRIGARVAAMAVRSLELASPDLTPDAVADLIGT